jgi:hypothetical protein
VGIVVFLPAWAWIFFVAARPDGGHPALALVTASTSPPRRHPDVTQTSSRTLSVQLDRDATAVGEWMDGRPRPF